MTKHLNLLVGGPSELWPDTLKLNQVTGDWLGIDRGNLYLLNMGITPLVAIGDFDSLTSSEFNLVSQSVKDIRKSIPEKDDTDTQLGLKIAIDEYHADRVDIYGATGGRIDHLLSNLWLVLEPRFKKYVSKIRIIDRQNTINYFLPGEYVIEKEPDKKYLGFVLMTPVENFNIDDAKYTLKNFNGNYPFSFASNEFIKDTVSFSFDQGIVCVIQSKDN